MNSGACPAHQITPFIQNTHALITLAVHAQTIAYGDSPQGTERDLYSLSWLRTRKLSDRPLGSSGIQRIPVKPAVNGLFARANGSQKMKLCSRRFPKSRKHTDVDCLARPASRGEE